MKLNLLLSSAVLLIAVGIFGCSSTGSYTSFEEVNDAYIGSLEKENFEYEGIKRNPLILIHGFLGARLKSTANNEEYWGRFSATDIFFTSDEKKAVLSHPMDKGKLLPDLTDELQPNGMLKTATVSVFGIPFEVMAYEELIKGLQTGGYVPDCRPLPKNKNFYSLFEFAYDWRRDLPYNAKKLHEFIKEKRDYIQAQYKRLYGIDQYDVQFDVVAHSMGGLLARYYLRYGSKNLSENDIMPKATWEGSQYLDRFVIVGTPNSGYLDTFLEILSGSSLQSMPPALLGTLPTYYQMFPAPSRKSVVYSDNGEQVDIFNPDVWVHNKWGLVDPKEDKTLKVLLPGVNTEKERFEIAYDHLKKCLIRAEKFIKAMSIKDAPPDDVKLYLVLGNGIKTSRTAYIERDTGKIIKVSYASGDGKITSSSAIYDLRAGRKWSNFIDSPIDWDEVIIIRAAHMGIIKSASFIDNVLFVLTMEETKKQKSILNKLKQPIE